jgi:amidohydrolase
MSDLWHQTIAQAQRLRHQLHRHPELSWQETSTAATVRKALDDLQIPWRPCADTGTVAYINPDSHTPAIALRGDMDALPINEDSGVDWASQHPGCMHACGHDGHTAALMATAHWLKLHEQQLPGPVTLLFQPAEEGGHGAREMIRDGALEGVERIYGWHNWPAIGFGRIRCPDGLVMCGNGTFRITVNGRGGHASQPELCRDPVLAASAITLALQHIVSRRLSPQDTAVVSVTSIEAPSGATVIPARAVLGGSIRFADRQVGEAINAAIADIARTTAHSYGVECDVLIEPRYQATINHTAPAQQMRDSWQTLFGTEALDTGSAVMASEDFSYYLQSIPGAFALIGSDDGEACHAVPCHSPHYDFNDQLIPRVVQLFSHLTGAPTPNSTLISKESL